MGGIFCLLLNSERVLTPISIRQWEKMCSVFGGHLTSFNFPPQKWEGYYVYSSIGGGFLHLCIEVGIISLPLLRSRHKIPPHPCLVINVVLVHDKFCLVLYSK
jgi:hypothetical protein